MKRVHALLRWARVEDQNGVLSLTTIAFAVGCVCLLRGTAVPLADLAAFAAALGIYQAKRHREYKIAQQQLDGAHEHAIAQQANQHELAKDAQAETVQTLGEKVTKLGEDVRALATPEQIEKIRNAFRRG